MTVSAQTEYLTCGQVARLLHVSPKTVNRWAHQGLLPAAQTLGGHLRFRRSDVEAAQAQMLGTLDEPDDTEE